MDGDFLLRLGCAMEMNSLRLDILRIVRDHLCRAGYHTDLVWSPVDEVYYASVSEYGYKHFWVCDLWVSSDDVRVDYIQFRSAYSPDWLTNSIRRLLSLGHKLESGHTGYGVSVSVELADPDFFDNVIAAVDQTKATRRRGLKNWLVHSINWFWGLRRKPRCLLQRLLS